MEAPVVARQEEPAQSEDFNFQQPMQQQFNDNFGQAEPSQQPMDSGFAQPQMAQNDEFNFQQPVQAQPEMDMFGMPQQSAEPQVAQNEFQTNSAFDFNAGFDAQPAQQQQPDDFF